MSRTHRAPTQQSNSYKAHDSTILDYNQAFLNRQNKNFEKTATLSGAAYQLVSRVKHPDTKERMTPTRQEDKKMKTEMKANRMELNMDELEQVNGGILPFLFVGALVAGTVTLFGVTAASGLSKDD